MTRTTLVSLISLASIACGAPPEGDDDHATSSEATESAGAETSEPDVHAAAVGDPRMDAVLAAHNAGRSEHCAAPLTWSSSLASTAQAWADHLAASGCNLEHSTGPYGENLAAATEGTLGPDEITALWFREREGFDFRRGGFSMTTGHFTQLVWAGTTSMGCGVTQCGGLDLWVCNYDPPGNVETQYRENVLPTTCR